MATPSALTPTPEQQARQRQLEAGRLRAGRQVDLGSRMEVPAPGGDTVPVGSKPNAEAMVGQALDQIGKKDVRARAIVGAAKMVGADKMIAKNQQVQDVAAVATAAQSGDVGEVLKAGAKAAWNWFATPQGIMTIIINVATAAIYILGGLVMASVIYCMMDTSCAYGIAENAVLEYFAT